MARKVTLLLEAVLLLGIIAPSPAAAWQISRDTSPVDDSPTVALIQRADREVLARYGRSYRPSLVIRCRENTTSVYIDYGFFLTTQRMNVTTRVDREKARQATWNVSTNYEAVGLWHGGQAIPFIKQLPGKKTLLARVQPHGENAVDTTFTLDGLGNRIDAVADACGWDASPPAPPPAASEQVRAVQEKLLSLGYRVGAADGVLGPRTARAINIFQMDEGLPETGELDTATLKRLEKQAVEYDSLESILDNVERLNP